MSASVGIEADHGGYALKMALVHSMRGWGCEVKDFGAPRLYPLDDYPDFVIPLAQAVARRSVARGIALCGSGVGVCIAANKLAGVRAAVVHDVFTAHQGVEDDDINVACLGGAVIGAGHALDLIHVFLNAHFSGATRHQRRLDKVRALENRSTSA